MTSSEDIQFLDGFKRKRVKLTLRTATFAGVVQRINLNKTLVLEDVEEVTSGKRSPGTKLFFGHEILNVELVRDARQGSAYVHALGSSVPRTRARLTEGESCSEGHLTVDEFQPYRWKLRLDGDEDDELYVNFVVIDELHEKFGPAVMHIRQQQVVGVGVDGAGSPQQERLCWLQIATRSKVYLFDLLLLGARAFKNGLSLVLESDRTLKVTHDCRRIAGCLMAQFGVSLTNVFDTQVADIVHFYTNTGGFLPARMSSLEEVVGLHLNMPPTLLSSLRLKAQLTQEDADVWYLRPCPVALLKVMALSVLHLLPLRLVLLDSLLADYTHLVGLCLTSARHPPGNTQHIGKSGMELPEELRELELIGRKRQEWALQHYPVTEDGLLERSKPRADAPPTTLPTATPTTPPTTPPPSPEPACDQMQIAGVGIAGSVRPGGPWAGGTDAPSGLQAVAKEPSDITGQKSHATPGMLSPTVTPRPWKEPSLRGAAAGRGGLMGMGSAPLMVGVGRGLSLPTLVLPPADPQHPLECQGGMMGVAQPVGSALIGRGVLHQPVVAPLLQPLT